MKEKHIVSTRKVGNSMMVTIPKGLPVAKKYSVYSGENDQLIFIPQQASVFDDPKYKDYDFTQTELIKGTVGREHE
ncbi:hypothetical protein LOOC260_101840 [Paucilactobacillus hokkaidonensis JCM 18461]|uniref:AbrB family transcriptional regulator n=2 Tax=Paucilactobacillus hokkaidonensis TaxID=1193095 RepID=A0A0A1GR45_9LACO|nr:hypothetical protein [Paucilactobacillus hokkaidonensis]KRO09874.1 hypothetical protein IV59_GL000342 [Paucilactobacillus hokkaidonensis]BAP84762.1 hypothetical protein LOOC260_101840 [Paucilactobacillus hokkaidonensis JCM 18461]